MRLYRIAKFKYSNDLSGEGARRPGGRWNLKGTPVIYTSDSIALATLEALVHTPLNLVPKNRSIIIFELPEKLKIEHVDLSQLPSNWRNYPPPVKLAQVGTTWINQGLSVALQVPSAIVPNREGWNYLLNSSHPEFNKIKIIRVSDYDFDPRLYQK